MSGREIEISDIVGMLADRIDRLVLELLPSGCKEGNEWRVGSVAGERGRSMGVHLSGPRAGVWCDWAGKPEDRGDALDLVAAVLFAGDKRQALRWSRSWLGLDNVDPRVFAQRRRQAEQKKREQARDNERGRRRAMKIFLEAEPQLRGTESGRYLAGRGIDFAQLGRQPRALRHHPALLHPELIPVDPETGELLFSKAPRFPALVAAITDFDGHLVAVHRTYLEALPDGRVVKLRSVEDAKLTRGRYDGACIRLWRGEDGLAFKEAARGEWVVIGEGIEDTATAVMGCPELRALVAVSAGNLVNIRLPEAVEGVILLAQNEDNDQARENWRRAAQHFHDAGKRVRIARPSVVVKDLNELLQVSVAAG